MYVRKLEETVGIEWGNGKSYRLLTAADKIGYTVCHTIVYKGTVIKTSIPRTFRILLLPVRNWKSN